MTSTKRRLFAIPFLLGATLPCVAASFDCAKASTSIEKAICASPRLSALDSELSAVYGRTLQHAGISAPGMRENQRTWLKNTRNVCSDEVCLVSVYEGRIWGYRVALSKLGIDESDIESHVEVERATGPAQPESPPARNQVTVTAKPIATPPRRESTVVAQQTPPQALQLPPERSLEDLGKPEGETVKSFVARKIDRQARKSACMLLGPAIGDLVEAYESNEQTRSGRVRDGLRQTVRSLHPVAQAYSLHMFDGAEHNIEALQPAYRKFGKSGLVELISGNCLQGS